MIQNNKQLMFCLKLKAVTREQSIKIMKGKAGVWQ
jgi:hypothetical protein